MNIQLAHEQYADTTLKNKIAAFFALMLSAPLKLCQPEALERIIIHLTRKKKLATFEQAKAARDAVCIISQKCRYQDRCIKRSIAVVIMLWLQGRRASWCTGYAMDPFRAHAWVEIKGNAVGESQSICDFKKVIKTPDDIPESDAEKQASVQQNQQNNPEQEPSQKVRVRIRDLFELVANKRKAFFLVLLLGAISSLLTLFQPYLISDMIENANTGSVDKTAIILLLGILFGSTVITTLQYYVLQRISEEAVFRSRKDLIRHVLQLPISSYSKWSSGDILSRMTGDTAKLRAGIVQFSVCISSGLILAIGASIGLLVKDARMFIITLGAIAISFIGIMIMSGIIQKASYRAQKAMGHLNSTVGRSILGIRTIRAANETGNEIEKAVSEAGHLKTLCLRLAKYQAVMTPVSNLGLQICGIVIIGIGGYRVSTGSMTIAELTSFVLLLYIAFAPFQQIFSAFSSIADALGSYARIKEITELPVESQFDVLSDCRKPEGGSAIEFRNVTFSYTPYVLGQDNQEFDENIILRDVSFSIPKGECTAIVGPSGAGKSTVLQLIERFYELNKGTILVDGLDYHFISRELLRNKIVYVEQNAPLLPGTFYDNMRLGNPNATEVDCLYALEKVNLSYLLERSKDGLHQIIDETGTSLSGGEKQRIAMARALLSDADIILLDELTSNLDSINEKIIKDVVEELRKTKTIIMVAHRLSTTVNADTIYVLEHGRIVGKGTHNELLHTVPLYRELAKEQMLV